MEDLRRCWKVPYIVYYCNLFEQKLDLVDLRVDEFEEAIIDDCGMERNLVIVHLLQKLLKPFINRSVDLTNFEQFLLIVLKRYNLESLYLQKNETTPIEKIDGENNFKEEESNGTNQWNNLSMLTKLDIIYNLCELRLQLSDIELKLNEYEPSELRIEPLGLDSTGNKLWYFGDLRLYEEKPPEQTKPTKKPIEEKKEKATNDKKANKKEAKNAKQQQRSVSLKNEKTSSRKSTKTSNEMNRTVIGLRRSSRRSMANTRYQDEVDQPNEKPKKEEQEDEEEEEEENVDIEEEEKTVEKEEAKEAVVEQEQQQQQQQQQEDNKENIENKLKQDDTIKTEEAVPSVTETNTIITKKPLIEEPEIYRNELKTWSCVCLTLQDWNDINEKYKQSKKKVDQEISTLIETSYLPEMPGLFAKAEKERMHRLLAMAPKRQSQRLQSKQQLCLKEPNSENESSSMVNGGGNNHTQSDMDFDSNDENSKYVPSTEQEKMKREEIAKQREERLRLRLMKRENDYLLTSGDDNSQSNFSTNSSYNQNTNNNNNNSESDFNIKNYFLMNKVMNKVFQCKYAWPFKNAVSEDDAPDYNTIIQNPMDLSTIQLKVNKKTYKKRSEFINDLELIVSNCLTYNGEDTYYGKLALKFENYCKRWLQIFYPREISTSLEEKNRQLMSLINKNEEQNTGSNANSGVSSSLNAGEDSNSHTNENTNELNGDNSILNEMMFDGDSMMRKKRKPNPDKEKYLAEPQYVTKRTSSGRIVRQKIINEYDYTSDQEKDENGEKRRRGRPSHHSDMIREGIQQKHRKNDDEYLDENNSDGHSGEEDESFMSRSHRSDSSISSNSSDSDDQDFGLNRSAHKRKKVGGGRGPGRPRLNRTIATSNGLESIGTTNSMPRQRRTIKQLTESMNLAKSNGNIFPGDTDGEDDSDNDLNLANFNKQYVNNSETKIKEVGPPKLTFEQYVKKLTGNYSLKPQETSQNNSQLSQSNSNSSLAGFSLKIQPAPAVNNNKLPVPIINPAIKTVLNKIQNVNTNSNESTLTNQNINTTTVTNQVKIITVPNSNGSNVQLNNKKFVIINNSANVASSLNATPIKSLTQHTTTTPNSSSIKIINITSQNTNSSNILTPINSNRPIIMINTGLANGQSAASKAIQINIAPNSIQTIATTVPLTMATQSQSPSLTTTSTSSEINDNTNSSSAIESAKSEA